MLQCQAVVSSGVVLELGLCFAVFNDCSISELPAVVSSGVVLQLDPCFAVSVTAVFQSYI